MNKYRILGCKFNGPAAAWVAKYRNIHGVGNYPERKDPLICRTFDIHYCLGMMALHHLGYQVSVDPCEFLRRGVNVVVDYFCGDWWKRDEESPFRWTNREGIVMGRI